MSDKDTSQTSAGVGAGTGVDRKTLESLICPVSQKPLEYDREAQELISHSANIAFPIRDGIPIMLVEEARTLE